MLSNNFYALVITFIVVLTWLRLNDFTAQRGWISSRISRKIIHMGTGPLFVLCWPLFTNSPASRYLAALVPFLITVQFFLVGFGLLHDEAAVQAMTRTGNPREILRGPIYYGIVFIATTILYWYESPIGIVALMLMCGGDGLADILGRRYGKLRLPWNPDKSWIGTLGMLIGGWIFAVGVVIVFVALRIFPTPWTAYVPAVTAIAIVGCLVESLPFPDIDNLTVTLTAVILGTFLF